jgi:hypothetical protein
MENKKAAFYSSFCEMGSGDRTRTCDLRVMSPTSYHLLYPALYFSQHGVLRLDQ